MPRAALLNEAAALSVSSVDGKLPSVHPYPVIPAVILALSAPLTAFPQAPAGDGVLIVERREDLRARDRLMRTLGRIRVDIHVENLDPAGLCRYLTSATGDAVNFIVRTPELDAEELAPISLVIDRIPLPNLLGVVQGVSDMRFVYRDGMVLLTHKDEVKPLVYMEMYDLRSATMRLRNSAAPKLGLRVPGEEVLFPPEEEETTTASGFTSDGLEDFLHEHVTPDNWGVNGVSLTHARGVFFIRHTVQGHQQVREALSRLGVLPRPRFLTRRRASGLVPSFRGPRR